MYSTRPWSLYLGVHLVVAALGQVETSFFVGSNFMDANGDWLAKPNAALYISKPGPRASTDIIVIVTLSKPVFNESSGALSYKVLPSCHHALAFLREQRLLPGSFHCVSCCSSLMLSLCSINIQRHIAVFNHTIFK